MSCWAEAETPLLSFFVICCTKRDETGGFRSQLHGSRSKFPRRWMHCQCKLRPLFFARCYREPFSASAFSASLILESTHSHLFWFQGPHGLVSVCDVRPSFAKPSRFFLFSLSCGLCCLCLCVLFSHHIVLAHVLSVCVFVLGHVVRQFAECTPRRTLHGDMFLRSVSRSTCSMVQGKASFDLHDRAVSAHQHAASRCKELLGVPELGC